MASLALILWLAAAVSGQAMPAVQLSEVEQKYLADAIEQRARVILQLDNDIQRLQKDLSEVSRSSVTTHEGRDGNTGQPIVRQGKFSTQAEKDKAYKDLRDRVREKIDLKKKLEDPAFFYPPAILKFAVGAIGKLTQDDRSVRIVQILGPAEMIVDIGDNWVMLKGFKTEGLVDDKTAGLSDVILVEGTYSYTTVMGSSKTIYKAVPFDDSQVRAYVKGSPEEFKSRLVEAVANAKAAAKETPKPKPERPAPVRTR